MAFVVGAVSIGAVSGLGGAYIQSKAAKDAARIQAEAADRASALQYEMYKQQRADQEPWRLAGVGALSGMQSTDFQRDFTANDFQKDPGYDFRMQEGQKALERSAAAKGGLQSGGTLRSLARYGQDYASNEYGNAYNRFNADRDRRFGRLSSIAGFGQNANDQNARSGMNYANQTGENIIGAGNANAASKIAQAGAWSGALSNIGNMAMQGAAMGGGGGGAGGGQNWMSQSQNSLNSPSLSNSPSYSGGRTYGLNGRMG